MVFPERPPSDAFDNSYQVAPNFHARPGLVPVSSYKSSTGQAHPLRPICTSVRNRLIAIYRQHNMRTCSHLGLYIAGSRTWVQLEERDRIVVLVLELLSDDLRRWHELDGEVRAILDDTCVDGVSLADRQVCIRYYRFRAEAENLYPDTADDNYQHLYERATERRQQIQRRVTEHVRELSREVQRAQDLLRTTRTLPAPVDSRPRSERMRDLAYSIAVTNEIEDHLSTPRMLPANAAVSPPSQTTASPSSLGTWAAREEDFQLPPLPELSEWLSPQVRDYGNSSRPRTARRGSVSSTTSRS